MGVSKYQKHITVKCACGCGEEFKAFPVYKNKYTTKSPDDYTTIKTPKTTLYVSKYKVGHHPKCELNQTQNKPAWNKGLTKSDHPSIKKMGFQPLHGANSTAPQSDALKDININRIDFFDVGFDFKFYSKVYNFFADSRRGSLILYQRFTKAILKRDSYTCQTCGSVFDPKQDRTGKLHIHHKEPRKQSPDRVLDPTNVIVLCAKCHGLAHKKINKQNAAP